MAADVAGGALAAWVGTGNNGFVRTWYDQSGNNSHAQQATEAAQPKIVNNGLLCIDFRGFPAILCDGNAIYGMTVTATGVFANDLFFATVLQPNNVSGGSRVFATVTGQNAHSDFRLDHSNQRWLYYSGASFVNTGTILPQGQNPIGLFGVRAINGSPGSAWIRKDGSIVATSTNMSNHTSGNTATAFSLFSSGPATGLGYVGTVTEFVAWSDSRPNTFQQIDDQLIRHYTRLPTASNADAQDWINRVYANGGTVSASTAAAVNTFCDAIDAAGIRDRFYRLGIFAGSNLNAALVPLYRGPTFGGTQYGNATDTNVGGLFVSGNYNETGASGGLLGDGSSKYLNTGLVASTMTLGNAHLSAYVCAGPSSGSFPVAVGAFQTVSGQTTRDLGLFHFQGNAATTSYFADDNSANGFVLSVVNNATGFLLGSAVSTSDRRFFLNGTQSGTTATGTVTATQLPANALFVFARNTSITDTAGAFSGSRLGGYSIGVGMSGTDAAAFNTAMQAFQTALTRNV